MWRLAAILGSLLFAGRKIATATPAPKTNTTPYGPPQAYGPPVPLGPVLPKASSRDVDILARTIWGEARGQGNRGMQAVANVVVNRFRMARTNAQRAIQFGKSLADICLKSSRGVYQFSAWGDKNASKMKIVTASDPLFAQALRIAEQAARGTLNDLTGGATHYLNLEATKAGRAAVGLGYTLPSWVDLNKKTTAIGQHVFLKGIA